MLYPPQYLDRDVVEHFEDFQGWDDTNTVSKWRNFVGTGASSNIDGTLITGKVIGVLKGAIDGTAGSRVGWRCSADAIRGSAHSLVWEVKVRFDTLPTDAGGQYDIEIGSSPTYSTSEPTDGIYFWADETDANWQCKCASASSRTGVDSGVAVAVDTWVVLRCEVDKGYGRARFFIDGALVATITTNIDTDEKCPIGMQIRNTIAGVAANAFIDYGYYRFDKRTTRHEIEDGTHETRRKLNPRRVAFSTEHWDGNDTNESDEGYRGLSTGGADGTEALSGYPGAGASDEICGMAQATQNGGLDNRAGWHQGLNASANNHIIDANGALVWEAYQSMDNLPETTTDEFGMSTGLLDNTYSNNSQPQDGVYFHIDEDSGNYFACCASGGTRTRTDTGVAAVASTWTRFGIVMTATECRFYINDNLVATVTTNIPTTAVSSGTWMYSPGATGNATRLHQDYIHWEKHLTR